MQKHASPTVANPSSAVVEAPRPPDNSAPIEPEILADIARRARRLVEKRKFRPEEYDDLVQEMTLEWLRYRPSYDGERNLAAFANRVTQNCITRLIRERTAARSALAGAKVLSLDQPMSANRGEEQPELCDLLSDDDIPTRRSTAEQEKQRDLAIDVAAVLATLPAGLREIAEQLQHYTISELAERTGIPRTTINERVKKLRQHFRQAGLDRYFPVTFR